LTAAKVYRVAFVGCRRAPLPTTKRGTPHDQLSPLPQHVVGGPTIHPRPLSQQVGTFTVQLSPSPQQTVGIPTIDCSSPLNEVCVPPQSYSSRRPDFSRSSQLGPSSTQNLGGRCDVRGPLWAVPGPWPAWRDGFAPRAMAHQELDKRSWAKRLDSLENELQTEPDRIRGPMSGEGPEDRARRACLSVAIGRIAIRKQVPGRG
jgi:hypothetical protein